MEAVNNPEDASAGTRRVPFSRVLYIEQDDFREDPPKQYFRLSPGREVRLRYGYFITCTGVVKDPETGEIIEVHCTYDPATRGGNAPDGRRVKSTIHWVSAAHAIDAEVRLYDNLVHQRESGRCSGGPGFHRESKSEIARSCNRRQAGTKPRGARRPPAATNSSGWVTSRLIRTARRRSPFLTGPWRSATLGLRSRRNRNDHSGTRRFAQRTGLRGAEGRRAGLGGGTEESLAAV